MPDTRDRSTRAFQIGFLVLLAVCAAQISWWVIDEVRYTQKVRQRAHRDLEVEVAAAERMLAAGLPRTEVAAQFTDLAVSPQGVVVRDEVLADLESEIFHRRNRFGWEGAFFVIILGAGMVVLFRTLQQQRRLHRRQQNFLAAISHELRSPLASIRLAADTLVLRDPPAERRLILVQRILEDGQRLEDMIFNILEASRIDHGRPRAEPNPLVLGDLVQEVVEELRPRLGDQMRVSVSAADGTAILADARAVRTVVRNLVDNAAKAITGEENGEIQVRVEARDGTVELIVHDNGRGFPSREHKNLFEKFYRVGDEMRRSQPGSGLGLYLVRRLVELDRGTVQARSDGPGRGAEFRVRWPARHEEAAA